MINWLGPFRWADTIIALVLVALTVFAVLGVFLTVDGMVERAAKRVSEARDNHWIAQIEKSNADAERHRAEQVRLAMAETEAARGEIDRLRASLTEMERVNASLPGASACGLDAGRVRALPR